MKKYFAYYNQHKNGINIAIDDPLKYAALALDCELQNWADAMDEDWCL